MKALCFGSILVLGLSRLLAAGAEPVEGDAEAGHDAFVRLSCASCHSVYRTPKAAIPLRDLSKETPETVANLIVSRTQLAPEALFDEMVMSEAASRMTDRELADIVAYLRKRR